MAVAKKYAKGVLEHGVTSDVRGKMVFVYDGGKNYLIGGGTLIESIYVAEKMDPQNQFILELTAKGIPHCLKLTVRTPLDALVHVKEQPNKFQAGSAVTFTEVVEHAQAVEVLWKANRKQEGIAASSCPTTGENSYAKIYERFVLGCKKHGFKRWDHFDNVKATTNRLTRFNALKQARTWTEQNAEFSNPKFDINVAFNCLCQLPIKVEHIRDAHEEAALGLVTVEPIKFAFPVSDDSQSEDKDLRLCVRILLLLSLSSSSLLFLVLVLVLVHVVAVCHIQCKILEKELWVFRSQSAATRAAKCATWMHQAMEGNTIFKPKKSTAELKKRPLEEEDDAKKDKKKKNVSKTGKGKKVAEDPSPAPVVAEEVMDDNATAARKKVWLDDVLCAIINVLKEVSKHKSVDGDWRSIPATLVSFQRSIRMALLYCFEKTVTINGKALKYWNQVRKEIKSDLVKAHKSLLNEAMKISNEASSGDITASILQKLDADDEGSASASGPKMSPTANALERMIREADFVTTSCHCFQRNNCNMPHSFHGAWLGMVSAINAKLAVDREEKTDAGQADLKLSLEFLGTIVAEELDVAIPKWDNKFVDRVLQVLAEDEYAEVVDRTAGILSTREEVKLWSKMRTTYVCNLLESLACGYDHTRVTKDLSHHYICIYMYIYTNTQRFMFLPQQIR